jgi:hypothetical protein
VGREAKEETKERKKDIIEMKEIRERKGGKEKITKNKRIVREQKRRK